MLPSKYGAGNSVFIMETYTDITANIWLLQVSLHDAITTLLKNRMKYVSGDNR